MFDVLEHIPEPVPLLRQIRECLSPGGLFLAKVPHVQFYLRWWRLVSLLGKLRVLPRFPTFRQVPPSKDGHSHVAGFFDLFEHVVHYDEVAVNELLRRSGFSGGALFPAPPTNPYGHYLNLPRSATYMLARALFAVKRRPGMFTHGLLILAW